MNGDIAVRMDGVTKRFGRTQALSGLDLQVPAGTVCGLLGPNGAGKTTAIRILATLTLPDSGRAFVDGLDVVRNADRARLRLGLAGQFAAVDEKLTGRGNLRMFSRLYHLSRADSRRRADDLLERFDLGAAADRPVSTYSGGMRRRLDVAASLITQPAVLFLDEPTTGLDPRGRAEVWAVVRDLVATGTTVLLTTQYLDEADQLADSIVVIDTGRVVGTGTPQELKELAGPTETVDVVLSEGADLDAVRAALSRVTGTEPTVQPEANRASVSTGGDPAAVASIVLALDAEGITIQNITVRRPTLDDVFLHLTGHPAEDVEDPQASEEKEEAVR